MDKFKKKSLLVFIVALMMYFIIIKIIGLNNTCIIKNVTGIPCPSCGLTRSGIELFKLNFKDVFFYNPMIFLVIIILLVIVFRNTKLIKPVYHNNMFFITCIIIVLGYYFYRMALYFPNHLPMDFDSDAIIPRIVKFLFKK